MNCLYPVVEQILIEAGVAKLNYCLFWIEADGLWIWWVDEQNNEMVLHNMVDKHTVSLADPYFVSRVKHIIGGGHGQDKSRTVLPRNPTVHTHPEG